VLFATKAEHMRWLTAASQASSRELATVILTAMQTAERFDMSADVALSDVIRVWRTHKKTDHLHGGWAQEARDLVARYVLGGPWP
jgi:hypothetical protein